MIGFVFQECDTLCPHGYVKKLEKCYKLHFEPKSHGEAQLACELEDAHLAEPRNQEHIDLFNNHFGQFIPMWGLFRYTYKKPTEEARLTHSSFFAAFGSVYTMLRTTASKQPEAWKSKLSLNDYG